VGNIEDDLDECLDGLSPLTAYEALRLFLLATEQAPSKAELIDEWIDLRIKIKTMIYKTEILFIINNN